MVFVFCKLKPKSKPRFVLKKKTKPLGSINLFFDSVSVWFFGRFGFLGFFCSPIIFNDFFFLKENILRDFKVSHF